MALERLRGAALFAAALLALLAGAACYFLIIGVFELPAATITLAAFVVFAVAVWSRCVEAPTRRGN